MNSKKSETYKKRADEAKELAFALFNSTRGTPSKGKVRRLAFLVMEHGLGSHNKYYEGVKDALQMMLDGGADEMDIQDVADHYGVTVEGLEDEDDFEHSEDAPQNMLLSILEKLNAFIEKKGMKDKVVDTLISESGRSLVVVVNDEDLKTKLSSSTFMGVRIRATMVQTELPIETKEGD